MGHAGAWILKLAVDTGRHSPAGSEPLLGGNRHGWEELGPTHA
jgi:hypothetical protein